MKKKKRSKKRVLRHNIYDLYNNCLKAKYEVIGTEVNYKVEQKDSTLYIYFEWSDGKTDWINNLRFRKRPYEDMHIPFKVHGGFLKCWEQAKHIIKLYIEDKKLTQIVIVGYSHGAALAVLCHEFCWFNRPDIRNNIYGYGFGCPRVIGLWRIPKKLKMRWENFWVIRKNDDLVTHVPPRLFGFVHVNKLLKIGSKKQEGRIKSHYPQVYQRELKKYMQENPLKF